MIARDRDADASAGNGLEERLYAVHDANYNVTTLVSTAGSVVERFRYTPYGTPTVLDANGSIDADGLSDVAWRYLHQGGRYDPAGGAGLYHFRHRDYSPTLGRWLEQDPLGYADGPSLYLYVASSPSTRLDPSGLRVRPPVVRGRDQSRPPTSSRTPAHRCCPPHGNGSPAPTTVPPPSSAPPPGYEWYSGPSISMPGTSVPAFVLRPVSAAAIEAENLKRSLQYLKDLPGGAGGKPPGTPGAPCGGNSGCDQIIDLMIGTYGDLKGTLESGFQAHHLNQNAAFSGSIPSDAGISVGLLGNAFSDGGSPHWLAHQSLKDKFWSL
ncbi:MAG TPA: RHS repeat-associated core domain-containing protein [Tepidisphaeraceae bacterium]|nr:RHS repeat-associated core domain-containing protein [Tepidisphaeraceae bacterium]